MTTGSITFTYITQARRCKKNYSAILSLYHPSDFYRFNYAHPPVDVTFASLLCPPIPFLSDNIDSVTPETIQDIQAFGRDHYNEDILIICNSGTHRGASAALIMLYDRLGPGPESARKACAELQDHGKITCYPNLLMLQYADLTYGDTAYLTCAAIEHFRAHDYQPYFYQQASMHVFQERNHYFSEQSIRPDISGPIITFHRPEHWSTGSLPRSPNI